MKTYSLYDSSTGYFVGRTFLTDEFELVAHAAAVAANTPAGHGTVLGAFDHLSKRVDVERLAREDSDALTLWTKCNGRAIARNSRGSAERIPPRPAPAVPTLGHVVEYQPPQPSPDHEWNPATKRWRLSAAAESAERRKKENAALAGLLENQQHEPMRRLALNPGDTDAKARLQWIDSQISRLKSEAAT